jgi:hypothetical protein
MLLPSFLLAIVVGSVQVPAPETSAPVIPFSSNGCSGFREAKFFSCCYVHDFKYWAGGTWSERSQADKELWRCVFTISGERAVADIGYFLLRLGILPGSFVRDGWGRAWYDTDRKRYAPLTPDQHRSVEAARARVCSALRPDPDTGWFWVDAERKIRPRPARELCGGDPLRVRKN